VRWNSVVFSFRSDFGAVVPAAAFGGPNFASVMSRDRWHAIKWCLAVIDNDLDKPAVDERDVTYNRLWKVQPLFDALAAGCKNATKPGRNITLDEMVVKFECVPSCVLWIEMVPCSQFSCRSGRFQD
jgi:hypothetical protein